MNIKTFYQTASLVMALVMALASILPAQAATTAAQAAGPSIYWGAMVQGKVPSTTNLQGVFNTFETRSKKKMSIIHWGQPWMMSDGSWGEFQTSYFTNVRNHGSIPMINWASHKLGAGINQPNFQLRDIYAGTYDSYIRSWATAAKNWGHPFFLYFNPEMNGWWSPWGEGKTSSGAIVNGNSPGDYVKAWRHVHDIFTSVGATNATWVWAPNHMSTSSQYPALSTLYPGDAYVDWSGLSVYNKYPTWAGLNPLLTGSEGMTWFRNSYKEVLTLAPSKPIMLAQWASIEAGDGGAKKAAWIKDALTTQIPLNFPRIKAVVWFNWQETANETYLIESSTAATSAWGEGISSGVYAPNYFANLNASPIPPLTGGDTTFYDVPVTHPYAQDIEILYANGLTGGCSTNPPMFCPDQIMNRAQSATFMMRGTFGSGFVPNPARNLFQDDWSRGTWARPWVEAMREAGMTSGCKTSPFLYCPWVGLPREQVVIFGLKMKYGESYQPPAATGTVFADMTNPSHYATPWAEKAYADGLIQSCGTSGGKPMFCPGELVSRGMGAYVIVRAKNLKMP